MTITLNWPHVTNLHCTNFTCGTISTGITEHESTSTFCHLLIKTRRIVKPHPHTDCANLTSALEHESWETVYEATDVNSILIIFINISLRMKLQITSQFVYLQTPIKDLKGLQGASLPLFIEHKQTSMHVLNIALKEKYRPYRNILTNLQH